MTLAEELQALLRGDAVDDDECREAYSHDASLFEIPPRVVAFPADEADVAALVRYAAATRGAVSLTPRCAGTDMSGGAVGESVVVDFTRYMAELGAVGEGYAVSQPGALYRDFEAMTLAAGQLLPTYPASRELCTVGGMAANNSGGEKSLRYGKTADFVRRLRVVLADGNAYDVRPLDRAGLDAKLAATGFEGDLYRRVYTLINDNRATIDAARPNVSKNSTGYALWDVWDGTTFDMTRLLTGSQGTLGIITEVEYRLVKPETHSKLLVIFLRSLAPLPDLINRVLAHGPESFESYDDHTLRFAIRYARDIMAQMKDRSPLAFALQFLPEAWMTVTSGGLPKQVLLAEFTGSSEAEVDAKLAAAMADLAPLRLSMRATRTEKEARKYWVVRRESFNLLRRHFNTLRTAPFIDDFCVRPADLPAFLPELYRILDAEKLLLTVVGHMGDANFHVIPLMDLANPETPAIIERVSRRVYELVFRYGGTMSGEHNDGLIRGPFLRQMYGERVFGLMAEVKRIFDPQGIFNPHKKTGATLDYMRAHLRKS